MLKRLALMGFVLLVIGFAAATLVQTSAAPGHCPRGYHLISCGSTSFCCPNNAFCVCPPY